ncbi:PREDICTED: carcinoembryonic antigen-related cell adhesion molecule 1-like [Nanorana parkeri]|uniref:carcinoembryonic antigen-related cell adhesion molecule 1-like n=1 Tax=Nanorana parkeri TaxID=125878 RepID=UPI0008548059|nr:PREDICTED: carcinoembryonic antigen-related cell adhesion molecule 1-like [Nanorana parkeri]
MDVSTITVFMMWMAMVSAIKIQLIPPYPVTKSSVTLNVTGITGNIWTCLWFKGPNTSFEYQILTYMPAHNSLVAGGKKYFTRAQVFPNGSLSITDLNVNDSGEYRVQIQSQTATQASIDLRVYELVGKPVITAFHSQVQEFDAINLTCSAANADTIIWKKDDASLQDDNRLSADTMTITLSSVNRTDAGEYQCEAQNKASKSTSDLYTLTVSYASECSTCDTNTAVISGVACAAVLIVAVLFTICFLLYKKCFHPVHEITDIVDQVTFITRNHIWIANNYLSTTVDIMFIKLPYTIQISSGS